MTNGTKSDKNETNLRTLNAKAKKSDKKFLHYTNSKSKISLIIRKNQLEDYVIEYLWQSKLYKKELIRNQHNLPKSIRNDIIENCVNAYSKSPWTSVLKNFLKLHNPTDYELNRLMTDVGSVEETHELIVLECWMNNPKKCHKLGYDNLLYESIIKNAHKKDYVYKNIVDIISYILENIPDMQKPLLSNILLIQEYFIREKLLTTVLRVTKINDSIVDYLLSCLNKDMFKRIIKFAMHKENISDNMMAKIYLTVD